MRKGQSHKKKAIVKISKHRKGGRPSLSHEERLMRIMKVWEIDDGGDFGEILKRIIAKVNWKEYEEGCGSPGPDFPSCFGHRVPDYPWCVEHCTPECGLDLQSIKPANFSPHSLSTQCLCEAVAYWHHLKGHQINHVEYLGDQK